RARRWARRRPAVVALLAVSAAALLALLGGVLWHTLRLERAGTAHLWDPATGQRKASFEGPRDGPAFVLFSPEGEAWVVQARDQTVLVTDLASQRPPR